jgi:hypothetical protein
LKSGGVFLKNRKPEIILSTGTADIPSQCINEFIVLAILPPSSGRDSLG